LGELSPTRVTIQLADQFVKTPKGKSLMPSGSRGLSTLSISSFSRPSQYQIPDLKLLLLWGVHFLPLPTQS